MTAQSIARCGWLEGWREGRLLRELGPPSSRNGRYLGWSVGISRQGLGPMSWELVVEQTRRHGAVKRATTELRNI